MTEPQTAPPATDDVDPTNGPVYQLPERPTLDPWSAVALAVTNGLAEQLAAQDVAVVIDPTPIANDVLAALGQAAAFPRIPEWTGDPRSIGGAKYPGQDAHPSITVDPEHDDRGTPRTGHVAFEVEMTCDHGVAASDRAVVPVEDAEVWALAVLAACRAAGRAPGHPALQE